MVSQSTTSDAISAQTINRTNLLDRRAVSRIRFFKDILRSQ
jgi:hypothetical protein